ncbi:hypothetical protein KIW84_012126 [Lathyrus oleraceus]|uniref:Uncharacterized protein n=1 Tax=Pisum sativum TaxID=3888 RepID=A0A9D5GW54_PEA|nr:hypothetical protein KIW84_012126 [Pisum sativum]
MGIDPKTNVVPDVFTSLAQPDNNTDNPRDKFDANTPTMSPEKLHDKERSREMTDDLGDKDKNHVEKNDQPTDILNIEELDSDDVPIEQRLALDIAKRLKNRKGQVVESSNTPSKFVRNKASVGPTKRWIETPSRPTNRTSILVELKDTCKTLDETIKSYTERKRKIEMLIKALSEEEGGLKGDGTDEEEENEDGSDASDDEDATSSDED